jgi:hypothetical protein
MFGKAFGKREAAVVSPVAAGGYGPAGPDPDGVTRVIPKAIWDGPHGPRLRKLGFQPDDPTNFAMTTERMRVLEDDAIKDLDALVAKVNAHIPGVRVVPWAVLPWSVWKDVNAQFLMKAGYLPCSPWNNLLLADDARSSAFLGLPEHPRAAMPWIDENVTRLVDELRTEFSAANQTIMDAISRGDFSLLESFEKLKTDRFQKLFMMMRYLANMVWGETVCARHDELFGIGLKGVTG